MKCSDVTYKAWEVQFPVIWEVFSAKKILYATRQPMVALRLDSLFAFIHFWRYAPLNRRSLAAPLT